MILCQFRGYSGSRVELVKENNKTFVRKTGNLQRNYQRLSHLESQGYPVACGSASAQGSPRKNEFVPHIRLPQLNI